jgi:hypothetical protein
VFANAHSQLIAPLTAAALSALPLGQTAYAELLIKVDKSAQRMSVSVNGEQLYNWPVTTGGSGYDTPGGTSSHSAWRSTTIATSTTMRRCPIRSFLPRLAMLSTALALGFDFVVADDCHDFCASPILRF